MGRFNFKPALFIAFATIVLAGFAFAADEPAKSKPAAESKPAENTGPAAVAGAAAQVSTKPAAKDFEKPELAFFRRHLLEAFKQHGHQDAKWDLQAEAFLDEWVGSWVFTTTSIGRADARLLNDAALNAGCDDPLVRTGTIYYQRQTLFTGDQQWELANQLAERGDAPFLCALAAARAADYFGREPNVNAEKRDQASKLAGEQLVKFLTGDFVKPGEERAAVKAWHTAFSGSYTHWENTDEIVEEALAKSKCDPWLVHLLASEYYRSQGWGARGTGFAGTVPPNGWRGFEKYMELAGQHLREAYRLKPEWPEAAAGMVEIVGAGGQQQNETKMLWFHRAVDAQIDYEPAYLTMFNYARPRWGGSHEELEAVGRIGLSTNRFDTWAPYMYYSALHTIANDSGDYLGYWRSESPRIYPILRDMFASYDNSKELETSRPFMRSMNVIVAYRCGEYSAALAVLKKLDDQLNRTALEKTGAQAAEMVPLCHALGGSAAEAVVKAQEQMKAAKWDEAEKLLVEAAEAYKSDAIATEYVHGLAQNVALEKQLQTNQWVDLKFDNKLSGWEIAAGQWKSTNESTITGHSTGDNLAIYLNTPIGHHFEFRGEVQIPKPKFTSDSAGPLYCTAWQPRGQPRSFLIFSANPAKQVALRRGLNDGDPITADVRRDRNLFTVSIWDKLQTVRLNDKVVFRGNWLDDSENFGQEERIGLGGRFWYEGPDVIFRNLQVRLLTEQPQD